MKVKDVMSERVRVCGFNTNLATAAAIMWEGDCGMLPVITDDGTVEGIITDRDIAIAVGTRNQCANEIIAGEVMTGHVWGCKADDDIHTALKLMRKEKVRRLPVVNDEAKLAGILSLNDVVTHAKPADAHKPVDLTYDDVMKTFKAICEHCHAEDMELEQPTIASMTATT
ncbi:MAG: CBS domain-containing protein [Acidobacteriota bacterium]